jgi:hypothetical protein
VFWSRRAPQHPELGIWCSNPELAEEARRRRRRRRRRKELHLC